MVVPFLSFFLVYIMDMTLHFRQTYAENKLALKIVTAVQKEHRKKFVFRAVLSRIHLYKNLLGSCLIR